MYSGLPLSRRKEDRVSFARSRSVELAGSEAADVATGFLLVLFATRRSGNAAATSTASRSAIRATPRRAPSLPFESDPIPGNDVLHHYVRLSRIGIPITSDYSRFPIPDSRRGLIVATSSAETSCLLLVQRPAS